MIPIVGPRLSQTLLSRSGRKGSGFTNSFGQQIQRALRNPLRERIGERQVGRVLRTRQKSYRHLPKDDNFSTVRKFSK